MDGYCYFLVAAGWLLIFPGGLWMVVVISWWPLDGGCYILMASGWLLIVLDGLLLQPMPGAHSLTHRIVKLEGNIWYEVGLPNLSTSTLSPPKLFPPPPRYQPGPGQRPCSGKLTLIVTNIKALAKDVSTGPYGTPARVPGPIPLCRWHERAFGAHPTTPTPSTPCRSAGQAFGAPNPPCAQDARPAGGRRFGGGGVEHPFHCP